MIKNKLLLSCAVAAIACGASVSITSGKAIAQIDQDFLAPPVVENVKEIPVPGGQVEEISPAELDIDFEEDPMVDVTQVNSPGFPQIDTAMPAVPELPEVPATIPVSNEMPEMPSPNVEAPAVAAVDEFVPEFPSEDPLGIPSPSPVANIIEPAEPTENISSATQSAAPSIPVPTAQVTAPVPVANEVVERIERVSEAAGPADDVFDYTEEKYYSSDRGVTTSDLETPTKADPDKDPAQKLVIIDTSSPRGGLDARFVAAQRALDLRRYSSALHMFEDLYAQNPRDQRILMGRAVALQMTGNEEKAIQAYEDLLELTPKNPKVLVNLLGLVSKQYPAVALERLKGLYEKNPGNAAIAAQMGIAEAELHNYNSAEKFIGIATSIEPENAKHYFNLAVVFDRNRQYKKAIHLYERALEVDSIYQQGMIKRDVVYDRLSRLRSM